LKRWLFVFLLAPGLAHGADFSDPDWPCVQRKVPHLSVGQMWAGPPISDQDLKDWRENDDAAALAPTLAVRRTSQDAAQDLIDQLAGRLGPDKARTLSLVFAGTFTLIERERTQVIAGIARYARTQTALSEAIEQSQNQLTDLRAIKDPAYATQDQIEAIEDKLLWDTRIFKDRQQSLTYVCETPVILERRAFAMARALMEKID